MAESNTTAKRSHIIDYGHMQNGVLYHGTFSDLDGTPKATWTFELSGKKTTQTRQLTEEQFDLIWNGVVDSDIFKKSIVVDPQSPVDPIANHVVSVFYSDGQKDLLRNYSIAGSEDDAAFLRWLGLLQIPNGSL